jgi:hypothetical protein
MIMLNVMMLNVVMMNVIMLNVIVLNAFMLNVIILNVIILNVVRLYVVMLRVVAPPDLNLLTNYPSKSRRQIVKNDDVTKKNEDFCFDFLQFREGIANHRTIILRMSLN